MGAAGLCSLLLLLLLGVPGRPEGPPPLCDPRVLEWFILEARDAERALASCGPHCELPEAVPVPYPGVNFNEWPRLEAAARAQDVRGGVATLEAAVQRARELLPDPRLRPLLERANSAARSLARLLREMTAQVTPSSAPPRQWQVRSLGRLLAVHSSFLHGKVRLFLMDACRQ
ncbi:erythropoietin [Pezoporus wallicus]|uniref:erythropoietin n=1 Tax=Pezoporus wallicus TaxID=35540 RepID=UPI002550D191|nr:erythropoietin [Pezoporus wallicus]XP_061314530.1 erythropoietin [Pezoporus flaviventris]